MKLTTSKSNLLEILNAVRGATKGRATLPILTHIKLDAGAGWLNASATNLDLSITAKCQADVSDAGAVCFPADKLIAIVKDFPAVEITIETNDKNQASIASPSSHYKLSGLPAEEFPQGTVIDGKAFTISGDTLRKLITSTAFAASTDESRFILNGVHFEGVGAGLLAVATDGRRLAVYEAEAASPKDFNLTIPVSSIAEIGKLEGEVSVLTDGKNISFSSDTVTITSKLLEGNFPNWRQVLPASNGKRVLLPRLELLDALKRASVMVSEKSSAVRFDFTKNQLTLTANTAEVGSSRESIAVKCEHKLIISFNPEYVIGGIAAIQADEIALDLSDDLSPGLITTDGFRYVIMPMRMQ